MKERGFSFIEVLVAITLVLVLANMAISQFALYRARAYDARVSSDTKSLATAEEAHFLDSISYTGNMDELDFTLSEGCQAQITAGNSGSLDSSFKITVRHPKMSYSSGCVWISDAFPTMYCS